MRHSDKVDPSLNRKSFINNSPSVTPGTALPRCACAEGSANRTTMIQNTTRRRFMSPPLTLMSQQRRPPALEIRQVRRGVTAEAHRRAFCLFAQSRHIGAKDWGDGIGLRRPRTQFVEQ